MSAPQNWGLTPDDDSLHPVTDPTPDWTETAWFSLMVPERGLTGYFYPVFRPALGVQTGGVLLYGGDGELPWELPYYAFGDIAPMAQDLDLRAAELPGGMSLRCTEPLTTYDFAYMSDELRLDLRFEAITRPLVTLGTSPFTGAGHVDQPGRVTGRMVLRGEEVAIDCLAMRDRGWGPRRFDRGSAVGYVYALASEVSSFLAVSSGRRGRERVRTGFLVRDGEWAQVRRGSRTVERDASGRPTEVVVDVTDELDRSARAHGRVVSRQVFTPYPTMLCWDSMVEWEFDGATCWGEDQDVWHPADWRDRASEPLA